jgi:gliding motility-associated-like protein
MKKILPFLCCLLIAKASWAQLDVVDNQTAQALAQTLVGQGVIMMNPVLNCPGIANGKFTTLSVPSNLGIDSGIVLTSGRAMSSGGLQGVNGASFGAGPSQDNGAPGDPDLNTVLSGLLSADRCVLEFDFIPSGDTVKFDYVFGSSEYQGFSCSSYNDIFGFFISRPGIPGSENIALIPGTNIPICVNSTTGLSTAAMCTNMGPGSPFVQYFINNTGGTSVTYSGFTTVFTASAGVVPCDTYHLKLAIADGSSGGSDRILDSGVFLKAGSLNSTSIALTPESSEGGFDAHAHCIRGCKSGFIEFKRPAARITPLTVKYLIEGTAVNGVDYVTIADSVVIQPNETTAILEIKPKLVQYPSPVATVVIKALSPYTCGTTGAAIVLDSTTLYIYDSLYVAIPTAPITVCPNTEISITAEVDPTLDYVWSPAALIPDPLPLGLTIHPKPTVTTGYTITVSQPGAPATCPKVSRTYFAEVEAIPTVMLPSHDTTVCYADSVDLLVYALPSTVQYTYNWAPASNLRDNSSSANKFFAPVGDYKYVVTATTPVAHCSNKDSIIIRVVPPFTFNYVTADTTLEMGDSIQLNSNSESIMWIWDPITYLDDPLAQDPYSKPLKDITYTLLGINQYGCRDTAQVTIKVQYNSKSGMPNAFSPNGDGLNDVFKVQNIRFDKMTEFKIFNRYGQIVFETSNPEKGWDGNFNDQPAAVDTYYYIVKLVLPNGEQKIFKGDVVLIR